MAALDWDDAEMWLEGAVQSKWSISEMRRTRWQANGGDPSMEPRDADVVTASEDEDFTPLAEADESTSVQDGPRSVAEGPRPDGPDFGDEDDDSPRASSESDESAEVEDWEDTEPTVSPFRIAAKSACRFR